MRITTTPPKDLAVEIEGDGPPVLMVHGLGGTSNFYQVQAQALADRFRVIRVDSAGAGRSPLADGISIESHAEDLAALLDQLGVSGATVVGHSMGTLVVRTLAARHPALPPHSHPPPHLRNPELFNPMFYTVDAFRYSYTSQSYLPLWWSLGVIVALAAIALGIALRMTSVGYKLRT